MAFFPLWFFLLIFRSCDRIDSDGIGNPGRLFYQSDRHCGILSMRHTVTKVSPMPRGLLPHQPVKTGA
jgi:hypothetical protein